MSPEKAFQSAITGLADIERHKESNSVLQSIIEELQNALQAILPFHEKFFQLPSILENQTRLFVKDTAKIILSIRSILRKKSLPKFLQEKGLVSSNFGDAFLDTLFKTLLPSSAIQSPSIFLSSLVKSI